MAHNARKICIKKNHDGIQDRFQRYPEYRDSQLKIGWTEEKCIAMDKLAQEDHSYCLSSEEFERYRKNWKISLNKSGKNAPMSSHNNEPSPPRVRRRTTRTNPFSSIPKVASVFFFQFFMVAVGSKLVELIIFCCNRIVYIRWQSDATDGSV